MLLPILLAMATAALALPQLVPGLPLKTHTKPPADIPPTDAKDYFSLLMAVGTGDTAKNVTLGVLQNGTQTNLYLVGDGPAGPLGTAAYLIGTNEYSKALQLNVHGVSYGLDVADIGHLQDIASAVIASKGYSEFQFQALAGNIYHELSSGYSTWLACERVINGKNWQVLAWGAMSTDGSGPEGCSPTSVYQNFYADQSGCD